MAKNLIIKTTMDNTDFDKKYAYLNKQLERELKNLDKLDAKEKKIYDKKLKLDFDDNEFERKMAEIQSKYSNEIISFDIETGDPSNLFEWQMYQDEANELTEKYTDVWRELENVGNELEDVHKRQEEVNASVERYRQEIEKISSKKSGSGISASDLQGVSSGMDKTLKKVAKWGLALFGIRTAYTGIRSAIGYVSQYNQELASKIESIKYTLAMALEPVIVKIVNLVYTLIQYINILAKAWFNVDLFANASAKSTKKAAAATKSLAGFDTANTLSDSSGSGGSNPSAMSGLPEGEVPSWLKWLADNGAIVLSIVGGIAAALLALKLGADLLVASSVGIIFAGLVIAIKGILDFIKDPTWQNFLTILEGIALVVAGIALLMGAWVVALIALGVAIVAWVIKNWDKVKEILGVVGEWINNNIIKPVANFFVGLWNGIKNTFSSVVNFFKSVFTGAYNAITSVFGKVTTFFSNLWKKITSLFKSMGQAVGNAFVSAFKTCINGVLKLVENVINTPIKAINGLISVINSVPGINLSKLSTIDLPRLAVGGIVNNPGRGIPVGGAIAGEAGREGVLPLTDSQAMSELGKEIGKWINVNVDLTTKLDSRVLSRSLQKVQKNDSFIRNGV